MALHTVQAQLRLDGDPTDPRSPHRFLVEGHRSMLYRFEPLAGDDAAVNLGAMISASGDHPLASGVVELHFRADITAQYAVPGTTISVWLSQIIGSGEVLGVVDPG